MKPQWDAVYVVWFCIGTGFGVLLGCAITLNYAMRTFRRWDRERYKPAGVTMAPWNLTTTTTAPAARFNPEDLSVLGSSDPPPTEEIKLHDQP